jgi:hypothetical protein
MDRYVETTREVRTQDSCRRRDDAIAGSNRLSVLVYLDDGGTDRSQVVRR